MAILLIHITDLHITSGCGDFVERADAIAAAALSQMMNIEAVHLVVTGDIANWGLQDEFAVAKAFCKRLIANIQARSGLAVRTVMVPGNHDCCFSDDQSVREILVRRVQENSDSLTQAVANEAAKVLKNFFAFRSQVSDSGSDGHAPWSSIVRIPGDPSIRYVLLNSAVLSLKKEEIGKLHVDLPHLDATDDGDVTIFLMHHPYNWLTPECGRSLARFAARNGDLFLMGHEHELWATKVAELYQDSSITYLKGHVLRAPDDPTQSAFQTIQVSRVEGFMPRTYVWRDQSYELDPSRSKTDYLPWDNPNGRKRLGFTDEGYQELISAGANFTHSRKDKVTLPDIFVWPNLKEMTPERDTGNSFIDGLLVDGESLIRDYDDLAPVIVIRGGEQFGKSALAKMLALHLSKRGVHPVLLSATTVSSWREKSLNERLNKAIDQLYGDGHRDEFKQRQPAEKVLILDDFDLAHIAKGYFDGIRTLKQHFGKIILMLDSYPGLEVALSDFLEDEQFTDSSIYEIQSSNYHLRLELIERWLHIGSDAHMAQDLKLTAAKFSKVVDEVLGRNLIPAVPIFVLIVMQQAELSQDLATIVKSGSHGFLYESMIKQALTTRVSVCDPVTALTYLSAFAAMLSDHGDDTLGQTDFEAFHVQHTKRYALDISVTTLQSQLESAEILERRDSIVKFKYAFHLYYFIARSLARQRNWSDVETQVEHHISLLHTERSANILLFLAHLTGDPRIADRLVRHATTLFTNYGEFDFFRRLKLFDEFGLPEIRDILLLGTRSEQLENHQVDEAAAETGMTEMTAAAEMRLQEKVRDALAMNEAFKAMQVLGQVLRNHAGEIEREGKIKIADACISLGFRLLTFVVEVASTNGADLIAFRGAQIRAEKPLLTDTEIAEELERYLPGLVSSIVVGAAIKIANAIGAEDLEPVLKEVFARNPSRELCGLITRLEHFSDFPDDAVIIFKKEFLGTTEFLPLAVLRRFIIRRFYLFPAREELKRDVLKRFGIRALPFQTLEQKRLAK